MIQNLSLCQLALVLVDLIDNFKVLFVAVDRMVSQLFQILLFLPRFFGRLRLQYSRSLLLTLYLSDFICLNLLFVYQPIEASSDIAISDISSEFLELLFQVLISCQLSDFDNVLSKLLFLVPVYSLLGLFYVFQVLHEFLSPGLLREQFCQVVA